MGDHLVLNVDRLVKSETVESPQAMKASKSSGKAVHSSLPSVASSSVVASVGEEGKKEYSGSEEEEPLIQMVECRICQEEDHVENLEIPCACSGSLKYAHRACVQRWCNEKGDITCEICHEQYKPGYTAPPRANPDETTIDISGGWTITGTPLDLRDPSLLAMAAAQHHFLEAEYDEYASTNASGAAFCRSAVLILMALLFLRHALTFTNRDGEDDASTIFSLFVLRAAGFLLPCYIMAWAISILQRRRQRQEAAALAATELAFILQSGQRRGLHFTIAPESPTTPHQEPHE
ncbi:uncharacterized protein LOC103718803 [Phoenix dactylifera]|uniref:Uncharacterized protein LOC103718803 n=1 Tax=Phoenix dactylifera TaxID=42345 RepID=A0A8B7CT67_PHODC|nr:uncharacterized protein LOC103718803 [Phoenix dactylifera]XP_008806004.1 uncharacterized protein LOC103718803 [Phoenix dactylifera]